MKNARVALLMFCSVVTLAAQGASHECFPLQLGIMPKVQVKTKDVPIHGLKLNVWHAESEVVGGVDLGIFSTITTFSGVQINAANLVQGKAVGLRIGLINGAKDCVGLAVGGLNHTDALMKGVAVGGANISAEVTGVQIGLFNYCHSMKGAQIGVVNIIKEKSMPFMPLLNMTW